MYQLITNIIGYVPAGYEPLVFIFSMVMVVIITQEWMSFFFALFNLGKEKK